MGREADPETWKEWVHVDYTYDCPTDNYLEGTTMESISEHYYGPARLISLIDKETKLVEVTLREWEAYDGRPGRLNCDEVETDCSEQPLVCEVLSGYHNNEMDLGSTNPNFGGWEGFGDSETGNVKHITDIYPEGVEEDPREKRSIKTPEGYGEFEWHYPIHPDELYDDDKTTYEDGAWKLYKNKNVDILGTSTLAEMRAHRHTLLMNTDGLAGATDAPASLREPVLELRQKLRDFPEELKDIDEIFVPSSFPPTKILDGTN
jgi:hypothetical protein